MARKQMFRRMDENGNGLLSPSEVERSFKKLLGEEMQEVVHRSMMNAFEKASAARESKKKVQNDTLDPIEFRQFLGDIKRDLFNRFLQSVHGEGDGCMSLKEFGRVMV